MHSTPIWRSSGQIPSQSAPKPPRSPRQKMRSQSRVRASRSIALSAYGLAYGPPQTAMRGTSGSLPSGRASLGATAGHRPACECVAMANRHDLVLVGMGSGGLVAAEFATTIGVKPVVVERDRVGGDCLWTGCVLSKALLAAGRVAHYVRTATEFGIATSEPQGDLPRSEERRVGKE